MQHKYERQPIPYGEKCVEEECIHCGSKSIRYKTGNRIYFDRNGERLLNSIDCPGPVLEDLHTRYNVPVPVESIMEDATVIIKVLYDDMMQAWGFANGQGMLMARRFLESKGMEI